MRILCSMVAEAEWCVEYWLNEGMVGGLFALWAWGFEGLASEVDVEEKLEGLTGVSEGGGRGLASRTATPCL